MALWQKGQSGNPKGWVKGTPNNSTTLAKEAILAAFNSKELGGVEGLIRWAKANPTAFYTGMFRTLVPHETQISGELRLPRVVDEFHDK